MTTRIENMACNASSSTPHRMPFLSMKESWDLFCEKVFGKPYCPPQLEKNGKRIVQNCRGLPLAITVISGLLSRSPQTPDFWENVERNISSAMISNDEQFPKILLLSYNHLPHHLKGCFLYMSIFPDDFDICVSKLVKLWVVEGLIKSANSKSLEDVAEENLSDLVDRNLVLVSKQSSGEKIKTCKIHDLLRDLCVREAKKVEFFHVSNGDLDHISKGMGVRRLGIHKQDRYFSSFNHQPDMCVRSLLSFHWDYIFSVRCRRLLRVLDVESSKIANFEEFVVELVGLLYLACARMSKLSESLLKLRNLQTVIVARVLGPAVLPSEIWKMSQLRHVKLEKLFWPVEAEEETLVFVLQRLETLSTLWNFRCTQRVLTGIPNLKKLGICYDSTSFDWEYYCLRNLVGLQKLESLTCKIIRPSPSFLKHITFPTSLQKLTLIGGNIPWDDMAIIGSLPDLQVLKLKYFAVGGKKWEPIEGHFLQLIFLLLDRIYLVQWEADNIHFPRLQHLVIKACFDLEEIPSSIGDIPTLQSIKVDLCRDSVVTSAKQILEEQHSSGNDGLQVQIGRSLVPV